MLKGGNVGQNKLGIRALIVMPDTTPEIKVDAVEAIVHAQCFW